MEKTAILGFGTIGGGVARLLSENRQVISASCGEEVCLGAILERRPLPQSEFSSLITPGFGDIENDPSISVVVEAMGGVMPAFDFAARSLRAKKAFITSNKELVACRGDELHRIAREINVPFLFEAAVGGGMPIIRPIRTSLSSTRINYLYGILNATSNFILSQMDDGESFDAAVKTAQANGYAEADPSADVLGLDACRKLCIMLSMITGKKADPSAVRTVGITDIKNTCGGKVKLIARAELSDVVRAEVSPVLLPENDLLTRVSSDRNGVVIRGAGIGEAAFFGIGAGAVPTASAILSDVVEAVRFPKYNPECAWSSAPLDILPWNDPKLPEYKG